MDSGGLGQWAVGLLLLAPLHSTEILWPHPGLLSRAAESVGPSTVNGNLNQDLPDSHLTLKSLHRSGC